MPRKLVGNRGCGRGILPELPTYLVQELNVVTVYQKYVAVRVKTGFYISLVLSFMFLLALVNCVTPFPVL